MNHYTMPYKYGKRTREFLGTYLFLFQSSFPRFAVVFNKTIIPLALVGYAMIIANSALRTSLAIYHLISIALLVSGPPSRVRKVWSCQESCFGHSPVLHCASLLCIILRVISARALENGSFFFTNGPRGGSKSSFSRKRLRWPIIFSVVLNWVVNFSM